MSKLSLRLGTSVVPFFLNAKGSQISDFIQALGPDKIVVVADSIVWKQLNALIVRSGVRPDAVVKLNIGESAKNMKTLEAVIETLFDHGLTRKSVVVAGGGGLIGNTVGLAAALCFRGVRLIHVPTTLLAMFDSVVSAKQAVNSRNIKNAIGTFYVPVGIIAYTHCLSSLPERDYRSGCIEALKNHLVFRRDRLATVDWSFLDSAKSRLESSEALVRKHVMLKEKILSTDFRESGSALIFEYGHTVGHALELSYKGRLTHGEAVGFGLIVAARVSEAMGFMDSRLANTHAVMVERILGIRRLPKNGNTPRIEHLLSKDNKRGLIKCTGSDVAMILLKRPGLFKFDAETRLPLVPVPMALVMSKIRELLAD